MACQLSGSVRNETACTAPVLGWRSTVSTSRSGEPAIERPRTPEIGHSTSRAVSDSRSLRSSRERPSPENDSNARLCVESAVTATRQGASGVSRTSTSVAPSPTFREAARSLSSPSA